MTKHFYTINLKENREIVNHKKYKTLQEAIIAKEKNEKKLKKEIVVMEGWTF